MIVKSDFLIILMFYSIDTMLQSSTRVDVVTHGTANEYVRTYNQFTGMEKKLEGKREKKETKAGQFKPFFLFSSLLPELCVCVFV